MKAMKLSDKLVNVSDTFEVTRYDNGFKVEVRGNGKNDGWATANILVEQEKDVATLFTEYCSMDLDE